MTDRAHSESSCKEFAELISAYFDHQLTDEQAKAVETHLAGCPACAQRLEDYQLFHSLMTAERQENPIDLNSAVMAGAERQELLDGLELMTKPPTPRWVKFLRALSAAAMIGIIVGTIWLIMRFNENSHKKISPENNSATLAIKTKQSAEVSRSVYEQAHPRAKLPEKSESRNDTVFDAVKNNVENLTAAGTPLADETKSLKMNQADMSHKLKSQELSATLPACGQPSADVTGSKSTLASVPSAKEMIMPNQPLVLQPSEKECEPIATQPVSEVMSLGPDFESLETTFTGAWPIPLVYRLYASDMPAWMLLKEQILKILNDSDLPAMEDHFAIGQSLAKESEFYYIAKKGLDLPPGPLRCQILLVISPVKFLHIYSILQFSLSDTVSQSLPDELKSLTKDGKSTARLADIASQSAVILRNTFPNLTDETQSSTKPAQTSKPAIVSATGPASTTQKITTIKLLPILIDIEIHTKFPATQPESMPATQPTTISGDFVD